jgi:hypothetical protein
MAISFVAAATSNTGYASNLSINKPTGTTQNDVMVCVLTHYAIDSNPSMSGWTKLGSTVQFEVSKGDFWYSTVWYKVAGSSEPSSYTISTYTSTYKAAGISTFRGVDTSDPIGNNSYNDSIGTSLTAPSISIGDSGNWAIFAASINADYAITPPTGTPTYTERFDVGNTALRVEMATAEYSSTGSTGTKSGSISTSRDYCAWHIELNSDSPSSSSSSSSTSSSSSSSTSESSSSSSSSSLSESSSSKSVAPYWHGCDTEPADGTGTATAGYSYIFDETIPEAGYITKIEVYINTVGALDVGVFRKLYRQYICR